MKRLLSAIGEVVFHLIAACFLTYATLGFCNLL